MNIISNVLLMGYTRLDTTTSKSLVAAHRRFRALKLFSIKNDYGVTSPSGHFWFHIGFFLLSTDVRM